MRDDRKKNWWDTFDPPATNPFDPSDPMGTGDDFMWDDGPQDFDDGDSDGDCGEGGE